MKEEDTILFLQKLKNNLLTLIASSLFACFISLFLFMTSINSREDNLKNSLDKIDKRIERIENKFILQ